MSPDGINPNPKPPVGRFGEIQAGMSLHIVDRQDKAILCDRTMFHLPGFPIGQEYGMTPYCKRCVFILVEMTG